MVEEHIREWEELTPEEQQLIADEDKYWKDESEKYEKEVAEAEEREKNFIDKINDRIRLSLPTVSPDVCYACASSLLGNANPYVRVGTYLGPLPITEMNLIIGKSGIGKTLPLNLLKEVNDTMDTLLPETFTVEGLRDYFARENEVRETVEEWVSPRYVNSPYGSMVIDEISSFFSQSEKKGYLAGSIETFSELFDGHLKSTELASRGTVIPQRNLAITVFGASTLGFIVDLERWFFEQGNASRWYWHFIEPKPTPPSIPIGDWDKYLDNKRLQHDYTVKLKKLLDLNIQFREENPVFEPTDKLEREEPPLLILNIDKRAQKTWHNFYEKVYKSWYKNYKQYPFEVNYDYQKRLEELALRHAGKIAIARKIDDILDNETFDDVVITNDDMEKGIKRSMFNHGQVRKMWIMRRQGKDYKKGVEKLARSVYNAKHIYNCLATAPNCMLSQTQLHKISGITDFDAFKKHLLDAVNKKLIKRVDKTTITDKEEQKRLNVKSRSIIFTTFENK